MGTFTVEIEVGDSLGSQFETVEALVDTGATYTMIPASVLNRLGVVPVAQMNFILADGQRIERDVGEASLRILGSSFHSPIVFANEDSNVLLGAVTLQIFGLGVDSLNERLIRVDGLLVSPILVQDE
ncbi:MAG: retroviral-like aspartic protease family protein [Dehalococcoidia bacterium]|nr:retroviral-like aspartic protease family protein [Dehalococcoidia bacterium]